MPGDYNVDVERIGWRYRIPEGTEVVVRTLGFVVREIATPFYAGAGWKVRSDVFS